MKMNEEDRLNYEKLISEIRYNSKTTQEGTVVSRNDNPSFKRDYGAISIFSIMCLSGYYEEAKNQTGSTKAVDIVNRMIDNALKKVDNTFLRDENWSAKI